MKVLEENQGCVEHASRKVSDFEERIENMGIIVDVGRRRSEGIEHHPRTKKVIEAIKCVDELNDYELDINFGGDGDSGEAFAYCLDVFFESEGEALKAAFDSGFRAGLREKS